MALATAHRVGELQALSAVVSSLGGDLFLSYLPEFGLRRSPRLALFLVHFVRSLVDFIGIFLTNSFSVLCALSVAIFPVRLLFLLVLALF